MKFAVEIDPGKFLLVTPDWSTRYDESRKGITWTDDFMVGRKYKTELQYGWYSDLEFFKKYYPQFKIIFGED